MSGHKLGNGTQNLPVNMSTQERSILSSLAASRDISAGALVRELIVVGLHLTHPDLSERIRQLRVARRMKAHHA